MSSLERGTIVAGRYRLERALAQGGMGCVWVARHLQLDVEVAIKFMTPQFAASADARARFEREAKASAALKLVNAVQVSDYGVLEDGAPFLVMELLEGEDLEARLRREGRLGLPVTVGIFTQVCRALRRAHEVGLVHRDLKPGNIFLARQGGEEVVKVLDFGIAKDTQAAFGGGATGTGTLLGSPHYMSPEQVRSSARVDHRSDLWALGVIAFRCLTGRLPFPGDEIGEVLVDVCTKPIPRASEIAPELGPEVDRFFERALARDLAQRFQSADELVAALSGGSHAAPSVSRDGEPSRGSPNPSGYTGPGVGPLPTSPVVAAPVVVAAPIEGTLSPSAQTRSDAARRSSSRRTAAILLVSLAGVGVVSMTAALLLLSGRGASHPVTMGNPAGVPQTPPVRPDSTSVPGAAPTSSAMPSAVPVPPPEPPPSATASASSAPASSAPGARPPAKSGPSRKGPGSPRKSDDLLDHI